MYVFNQLKIEKRLSQKTKRTSDTGIQSVIKEDAALRSHGID